MRPRTPTQEDEAMRWISRSAGSAVLAALVASGGCVTAKKHNELQTRYDELDARYTAMSERSAGQEVEIDDLEKYVELLKASNDHLGSFYEDLLTEFRPQLESDELELIVYPDRMSLALAQDVSFDTASSRLSRRGDETLDKLATLVSRHPDRRFVVEGHTDSRPISTDRFRSNWELGAARAVSVVEALIAQGVPAERLAAASYGDTEPIAPNDSPETQRLNRRVEVSFQPTLEELPGHRSLVDAAQQVTVAHGADTSVVPEMGREIRRVEPAGAQGDGAVPADEGETIEEGEPPSFR
jgi:chemotaxis protein MotB